MKMNILPLTALVFLSVFAFSAVAQNLNLTIYNNDLGVVRETRSILLKKGISDVKITDVPERINPSTVKIKLNGKVLEQNYKYDLANINSILSKYIDKEIILVKDEKEISGILISASANQIVLKRNDGGIIMVTNLNDYRLMTSSLPDNLITRPTLVWKIESDKEGAQNAEMTYHTGGMSWKTEYVAVLSDDEKTMSLDSWVNISNTSGLSYNDAEVKLVAGKVNTVNEEMGGYASNMDYSRKLSLMAPREITETPLFEYHLYTIPGKTSLADNEDKQIALYNSEKISVNKILNVSTSEYTANQEKQDVNVVIEFLNSKSNNLGMALPAGIVRMHKTSGKNAEFIGEDQIDHTPKDEKIKLRIGKSFDITAKQDLVSQETLSERIVEKEFKVKLANRKDAGSEKIEYEMRFYNTFKVISCTHKYEILNNKLIIKLDLNSGKEEEIKFKVRVGA